MPWSWLHKIWWMIVNHMLLYYIKILIQVWRYWPWQTYIEFKCTNCDSRGSAWSGKSYKMLTSNITRKQGEPNLNNKIRVETYMTWCNHYDFLITEYFMCVYVYILTGNQNMVFPARKNPLTVFRFLRSIDCNGIKGRCKISNKKW